MHHRTPATTVIQGPRGRDAVRALALLMTAFAVLSAPSSLAAPRQSEDRRERVRADHASLASTASMVWMRNGSLEPRIHDPLRAAKEALADLPVGSPLAPAAQDYVIASMYLKAGHELARRRVTIGDVKDMVTVFLAGLDDDLGLATETIMRAMFEERARQLAAAVGNEIFAQGIRHQEKLWRQHLVGHARAIAGTTALAAPGCVIAHGQNERTTGLAFKNTTGRTLDHVTLSVRTHVGGRNCPFEHYFVFVPRWSRNQEIYLPPTLVGDVMARRAVDLDRPVLQVSLWSDQGRLDSSPYTGSAREYDRIRARSGTFRLTLAGKSASPPARDARAQSGSSKPAQGSGAVAKPTHVTTKETFLGPAGTPVKVLATRPNEVRILVIETGKIGWVSAGAVRKAPEPSIPGSGSR